MAPTPTVREMARLALPLGSQVMAGELGLERNVRWARTGGVLSPLFPVLNADEVALLDLPLVQASNPSLTASRVVRELSRLRVAAIVVKGQVDTPTLREADRTNTPLYLLPSTAEIPRVSRAIIRLLSDREAQEEAQAGALYRLLSQQMVAENGLEYLTQTLYHSTGHAVSVSLPGGEVLANAGVFPQQATTKSVPIVLGDEPLAILTLGDYPARLDDFTTIALEQGAAALALELAKLEAIEAVRAGVQVSFLTALLRGEPEHVLMGRARAADVVLDDLHWIVMAVIPSPKSQDLSAWLKRATRQAEESGWMVHSSVDTDTSVVSGAASMAILLLSGGGEWGRAHTHLLTTLRELWSSPLPLSFAVGDPAYGVTGLQKSLAEARDALTLGTRLLGTGRSYLHREMGVYRLLRYLQGTDDLAHFLDRTLSALEAYDKEHDAELMTTLNVLLEQGGNVSAAAKAMHLHRNSLIYRVERIRDIANLDPTNPEDAFTLRLALMLAPLR